MVTTLARRPSSAARARLIIQNATGLVFPLPLSYAQPAQGRCKGITAVTWANWFGGRYGDGKRFFAQFAVDPESYLAMYPEIVLPEDQKQAFLQERSSAIVGRAAARRFRLEAGPERHASRGRSSRATGPSPSAASTPRPIR